MTWLAGPDTGQVADDDRNKALVICNRLVMAYTGLAQITGSKTDEWLLDVVSKVIPYNPQRVCETVAERAAEEFRRVRLPSSKKRHAFLVSGWAKFNSQNAPLTPFVSAIANALDDQWHWVSEANDLFQVRTISLADRPFLLAAVGQPIDSDALKRLRRQVRNYTSRERGPEAYIQMLATAIRDTATSNRLVGRNLMAVSLPRTALGQDSGLSIPLAVPFQNRKALALYLPESGEETIRYAPNYTCEGMSYNQVFIRIGP
ncbi:MAG: hypothetical protein HY328_19015 [Chloroflexi bacterium]|nr:hypothetical protein [Chloroflexota bacterium]